MIQQDLDRVDELLREIETPRSPRTSSALLDQEGISSNIDYTSKILTPVFGLYNIYLEFSNYQIPFKFKNGYYVVKIFEV